MTNAVRPASLEGALGIVRGTVLRVDGGSVRVALTASPDTRISDLACTVLCRGSDRPVYEPGDPVLVWRESETDGTVLGKIGLQGDASETAQEADEVVLEARKRLTLRVGGGSITIREDGKILIKGKDLVSHAKRMNRIRGGSVAIN